MTLDEAIKQNPYDEKQNNLSAYVRYLRYTVDGFYSKTAEEVKARLLERLLDASSHNQKEVNCGDCKFYGTESCILTNGKSRGYIGELDDCAKLHQQH